MQKCDVICQDVAKLKTKSYGLHIVLEFISILYNHQIAILLGI